MTHLAFYAGWSNAAAASEIAMKVFATHRIGTDQLRSASPKPIPLNEAAEADRAKRVGEQFGTVSLGHVLLGRGPTVKR